LMRAQASLFEEVLPHPVLWQLPVDSLLTRFFVPSIC
jgi:hypothetical protein